MLYRAATYTPLAGAHATAAGQLGRAPIGVPGQCPMGHVFAAADQGVGTGQRLESRVEGECLIQRFGEPLPACPAWPQLPGRFDITHGGVAGNRTFDQGQFLAAAEAGAFTRRVMIDTAGLPGIHHQRLAFEGITRAGPN